VPVLAEYLGVSKEIQEESTGEPVSTADIGEALHVGAPEELYRKAQAVGYALGKALLEVKTDVDAPSLAGLVEM